MAKKTQKRSSGSARPASLGATSVEDEIARLSAEIERHDALYYRNDAPEISDADYDALRRRLTALEDAHPDLKRAESPSEKVGFAPVAGDARRVIDNRKLLSRNAIKER